MVSYTEAEAGCESIPISIAEALQENSRNDLRFTSNSRDHDETPSSFFPHRGRVRERKDPSAKLSAKQAASGHVQKET